MPFSRKIFRPAGTGVGRFPAKESQSLKPEFQSRCSVFAPMPWMCINVLVSMINTISGFELRDADAPARRRSMLIALEDLHLAHIWVIYPGDQAYDLHDRISVFGPTRDRILLLIS